ncbi:MAG: aminomethyl-transferring glycine dehydrogenase [Flavobacteriales bacterium]|nr:aminomethyl-transferring glycine dehydrogenase [Flavobacteriales bacterium]
MENSAYQFEKFSYRHNSPSDDERLVMLESIGFSSVDELIRKTVPDNIRLSQPLNITRAVSEFQFIKDIRKIAQKNKIYKSYIGAGYYNTITPPVILRNIMENPGWYTQYTPYQAEISQGRLEALLNFQTMISDLTGLPIANASLLDEGTAAAEAMNMFHGLSPKENGNKFFVSKDTFPQTLDILKTRAEPINIELVIGDYKTIEFNNEFFGAYVQYPDNLGNINDYRSLAEKIHSVGGLLAVGADLMSLTLLTPPAEFGADCVIGNSQRFGVPLGYGGPHAAYFSTKDEYKRQIPGRIIGVSVDAQGNHALRMALQTREQHIRRDKATSNICTAQVLLAIMAGMYGVYHGPGGLKKIAGRIAALTNLLDRVLKVAGFNQVNTNYFDTLCIEMDHNSINSLRLTSVDAEMNFRYFDEHVGVSIDETTGLEDIQQIVDVFTHSAGKPKIDINEYAETAENGFENTYSRTSDFMLHHVFNFYHSEHELLRYIKSLEVKDLSLCQSMISLGSCTMKLNATTEMIPVTWPEFNQIHPFVPLDQAIGYKEIIDELSRDLCEITGFAAMSLQPNAGSQGEYAGLMVIREYFKDLGQSHRNIALIPESAHGTNPASAVMAGMKIVIIKCLEHGYIDVDDLKSKAEMHKNDLACLMVTYPSTFGIYEETIKEITQIVHDNGGQVYMDGANMNAQVGLTNPGMIGADVCHLNLHKTFCIPHGGGGPGMGPIGVAEHLKPYLPGHPLVEMGTEKSISAISAAPWGSASILLISYAYIKMMGRNGLKEATETAILNANYIQSRLKGYYESLYTGINGTAAHELIIDTRVFKASTGVEVEDIAKRLMDYGFHAPTVSFPVAGTMMIEPTESEGKEELDRFCDALIEIRNEIREIEQGLYPKDNNVLKNAPHTALASMNDHWESPYTRHKAVYPLPYIKANKFWPSVARVNNTYGDRNLVCSCLPLEAYAEMGA